MPTVLYYTKGETKMKVLRQTRNYSDVISATRKEDINSCLITESAMYYSVYEGETELPGADSLPSESGRSGR